MQAWQLQYKAYQRVESITNLFESLCDLIHYAVVTSRRRHIEIVHGRRNDVRENPALRDFQQKCAITLGEGLLRTLDVPLSFAAYLSARDGYHESMQMCQDILDFASSTDRVSDAVFLPNMTPSSDSVLSPQAMTTIPRGVGSEKRI